MRKSILFTLSLLVIVGMIMTACAAPAPTTAPEVAKEEAQPEAAEPVTVNWWHIQSDPGAHQTAWQEMADAYMADHPNVNIKITILENEAFKSKLPTVMQSGDPPDLFQSWGGGTMNEYAKAGLLKDITADVAGETLRETLTAPEDITQMNPRDTNPICDGSDRQSPTLQLSSQVI